MEQLQLRLKNSGKTVVYTANDISQSTIEEFLKMCLVDYGIAEKTV